MDSQEIIIKDTPPKVFTRNDFGLIKGFNYTFDEQTGLVNWRALVKPEHLVPNRQNFQKRGKPIPESIEGLEDRDLLILLIGMKEICNIRGFNYVKYIPVTASPEYCCFICEIEFIGNYESFGQPIKFQSIADASLNNTESFAKNYLSSICENRAFVRCVRNALRINVLGKDEIGQAGDDTQEPAATNAFGPNAILEKALNEKKITFEQVKAQIIKDGYANAEKWVDINSIPRSKVFDILTRLQKKEKD